MALYSPHSPYTGASTASDMFQVQDAQATMRLYTMIKEKWEKLRREKRMLNKHIKKKQKEKNEKSV